MLVWQGHAAAASWSLLAQAQAVLHQTLQVEAQAAAAHLEHKGILVGGARIQQLVQRLAPAQPAPPRSLHMRTKAPLMSTSM